MPGSFLDSNVILYLASEEQAKADCAEELVTMGGTISIQVLNEVANVSRRKMKMSWPETRTFLSTVRELLNVESITIGMHETGIDLAEQPSLFRPFYRTASARKLGVPGVGLGLAVAARLARAFGGTIEVESEPGKGSRFRLSYPLSTRVAG